MTLHSITRFHRRPAWLPVVVFLFSALSASGAPATGALDRVLVTVNDDIITESELNERLADTRQQLAKRGIPLPPNTSLDKQVLDAMILEHIQMQRAVEIGISVTENQLDNVVRNLARQNNLSLDAFLQALKKDNIDPAEFRQQLRRQITIRQLMDRLVNSQVAVSENEIDTFLEEQAQRGGIDEEYDLSHILIPIPETANREARRQAAEQAADIHRQLKQGVSFEQLAITYSKDQSALEGGKLGWKKAGQLPDLFLGAVKTLQPRQVSGVLRSVNGFHILRLNDRRGGRSDQPIVQTHARHILIRSSEILSINEARDKLTRIRQRIEEGEDFATLARAYSEDLGSGANGGDLGWIGPDETVPEFEKAMNALQPKQVSPLTETRYGFHVIQVLERRTKDVGMERQRVSARKQIHARKAEERFQQWLQELRDAAYVEFHQVDND